MKNYLIAGGAGFIGTNFIKYLLSQKAKYNIYVLDKLSYASNISNLDFEIKNHEIKFYEGDIGDKELVKEILEKHNINIIINFAAESHVDNSINNPTEFIKNNVYKTSIFYNTCNEYFIRFNFKKDFKFIQISTDEVYGSLNLNSISSKETDILKPRSPYSSSKASSDLVGLSYFETYNFPIIITRCSNNFGIYQFHEKLIPLAIKKLISNEKIPIYGNGENIREWISVEKHCEGIYTVIKNGKSGEIYNIGSGYEIKNIDLIKKIIIYFFEIKNININLDDDFSKFYTFVKDRKGHDLRYSLNIDKIQKIGFNPSEDFDLKLKKVIKWYLEND